MMDTIKRLERLERIEKVVNEYIEWRNKASGFSIQYDGGTAIGTTIQKIIHIVKGGKHD